MAEPIVIIDSDDDSPPTIPKEQQPSIEKGWIITQAASNFSI